MATAPRRFASGFAFPEGPVFDRAGNLFVVNIHAGTISRISPRGKVATFVATGGAPNGAKFHANGHLFVCDSGLKAVLDISPDGAIATAAAGWSGTGFRGPNDLVFAADGAFYCTDPADSSLANPIGAVYRVDPDGTVSRFAQGLAYPNGIALSADERRLYVAETLTYRIHEFVLGAGGLSAVGRIYGELPHEGVGPDGMAFDVEGNLYVACYGTSAVFVLDRWGNVARRIPAGGERPTNVAFGGKDRRFLYITETETNAVYVVENAIPGLALFGER